jgi:putative protease
MKSVYYVALVTRAYRKALDAMEGKISSEEAAPFVAELENVSHRESGTGFYYNRSEADKAVSGAVDSRYILAAEIGTKLSDAEVCEILNKGTEYNQAQQKELEEMHPQARAARERDYKINPDRYPEVIAKREYFFMYKITPLNMIRLGDKIEFISPDVVSLVAQNDSWTLVNPENGTIRNWVCDGHECIIYTNYELQEGTLIRIEDPEYVPGVIRDKGR